jgi:hypothetical protein
VLPTTPCIVINQRGTQLRRRGVAVLRASPCTYHISAPYSRRGDACCTTVSSITRGGVPYAVSRKPYAVCHAVSQMSYAVCGMRRMPYVVSAVCRMPYMLYAVRHMPYAVYHMRPMPFAVGRMRCMLYDVCEAVRMPNAVLPFAVCRMPYAVCRNSLRK